MFSRAHLLIEKEIQNIIESPPWGVEIEPLEDDNHFEWLANIHGLRDSIWEGGVFQIYLKFDEHFNVRPPEIFFQTIPFHPNVDMATGRPCVDYLDDFDLWQPNFSLSMILVTLQMLLSNPNLNHAINLEAIEMMSHSPQAYRQLVIECVAASQRFFAETKEEQGSKVQLDTKRSYPRSKHFLESFSRSSVDDSHLMWKSSAMLKSVPNQLKSVPIDTMLHQDESIGTKLAPHTTVSKRRTKVSFDDYHNVWKFIATSKPMDSAKNDLLEMLKYNPHLQTIHMGIPQEQVKKQMDSQIEEHKHLMLGCFNNQYKHSNEKDAKLAKLQKMKKIYLPSRNSQSSGSSERRAAANTGEEAKGWEKEVDDLVKWTNNLDDAAIDT